MKKLIIVAVAMATALAVNAASVSWKSGTLYGAGEGGAFNTTKLSSGVTAEMYTMTASQYSTVLALFDGTYSNDSMMKFVDGLKDGTYGSAMTASKYEVGDIKKNAITVTDNSGYTGSAESPATYYTAILYTYNDGSSDWYVANAAANTFEADINKTLASAINTFGGEGATGSFAISGWSQASAVPEPTSGLLMLVGLAGLALRRKRA